MRALLSTAPGGPQTLALTDVPDPAPGAGEVVIGVRAVGLNYPDVLIIEDKYQARPPRPFAPGAEAAGVVLSVGLGVARPRVGDRVAAFHLCGALAEQWVVPATSCVPVPDGMDDAAAAAFLLTYGTAYHALHDRARLSPNETVLVLGAAGGVGIAAVELGVAAGARVIAAASSAEKAAFAKGAGAAEALVYPSGPLDKDAGRALSDAFKTACGKGGADVIFDPVGGAYAEPAFRAIAWGGRHLVVGFTAGPWALPTNLPLLKGADVVGVFWGAHVAREPERARLNLAALFDLFAKGAVRPRVSATYPLDRAPEALAALAERRALGKLVVTLP